MDRLQAAMGQVESRNLTRPWWGHHRAACDQCWAANVLAEWFRYGWAVLDIAWTAVSSQPEPSVIPNTSTQRSTSQSHPSTQAYLYVGTWNTEHPGDPSYWNAPFGAVLTYDQRGIGLLRSQPSARTLHSLVSAATIWQPTLSLWPTRPRTAA